MLFVIFRAKFLIQKSFPCKRNDKYQEWMWLFVVFCFVLLWGITQNILNINIHNKQERCYWWIMSKSHISFWEFLHTPNENYQPIKHHANSHIYNVLCIVWGLGIRNRCLYFNHKTCLNTRFKVSLQCNGRLVIFFSPNILHASNKNQISKVEMISN